MAALLEYSNLHFNSTFASIHQLRLLSSQRFVIAIIFAAKLPDPTIYAYVIKRIA